MIDAISRGGSDSGIPPGTDDAPRSTDPAPDSPAPATSVPPDELSFDVVFDVLSNARRRLILEQLRGGDGEATLSDLAAHVAAVENDKPEAELSTQERKRVYVSLYQNHLPRMEDVDVVETSEHGVVTLGSNADDVLTFLGCPDDADSTWQRYYAAHTGVSAAALLVSYTLAASVIPLLFAASLFGYAVLVGGQISATTH